MFTPAKFLIQTGTNKVSAFPTMALADQMRMPVEAFLELASKDGARIMQAASKATPIDIEECSDTESGLQRLAMRHPEAVTIESFMIAIR